jgi:DMSO reductase anchor subunit
MELLLPEFGLIFWVLIIYLMPAVIALISILRDDFKDSTTKLIWVLVVIFLGLIGAILYFSIGRKQSIKKN